MRSLDEYKAFLESLARAGGALLREHFFAGHTIHYKGEIDLVTEADRLCEILLADRIRAVYPGHDILAEESGATKRGSEFCWIIDPLDGTTNYAHGYPVFCLSVALAVEGVVRLGAVYDPLREELFTAQEGGGAFMNGRPIRVSHTSSLGRALLATGFPYDIRQDRNNNLSYFKAMALSAQAIRRAGSAALDLAYVACGRFDGFWEIKLRPWDTAAGWLLVTEAGGKVTDIEGAPYELGSFSLLASNGLIHAEMASVLQATDPFAGI